MRHPALRSILTGLFLLGVAPAWSQQSDFETMKNFNAQYEALKSKIDSAATTGQLDSLKPLIDFLEMDFSPRSAFLDKALYPETFQDAMNKLRNTYVLTYDRVYLIQTRGVQISELEAKIVQLTGRLDTLTSERDSLFAQLEEHKRSLTALRAAMKQLSANLQAKDRLIFALVDSIFLPYGKELNQMGEVQREAINKKLERTNVVQRVYDIAADNVKFLDVTQLQAKDYADMIDQYQQFNAKWDGLREKMNAVAPPSAEKSAPTTGKKGTRRAPEHVPAPAGAQVDSVLAQWHTRLMKEFWAGLMSVFTSKQIPIKPFASGEEFAQSVREYVGKLKSENQDASVFVNDVWKERIDKDWREALSKNGVLGKAEYAALDEQVSELSRETVDLKFVLYIVVILLLLGAGWWFFVRKPKSAGAPPPEPPPSVPPEGE